MSKRMKGYIGVDLDKTLAKYDKWRGVDKIGEPIPLMVARVRMWLSQGKRVKIFTARVATDHSPEEIVMAEKAIKAWCKEHIGQELEVTAMKHSAMYEYWDDKAISVEPNTGLKTTER